MIRGGSRILRRSGAAATKMRIRFLAVSLISRILGRPVLVVDELERPRYSRSRRFLHQACMHSRPSHAASRISRDRAIYIYLRAALLVSAIFQFLFTCSLICNFRSHLAQNGTNYIDVLFFFSNSCLFPPPPRKNVTRRSLDSRYVDR